ncbi:hypothetical protein [Lentzea sp. NBRC 102530]|uniref:hypothetical protein n=1 Tax=Lentzea sp. NBRC 102530 TaxID=3032201 RepID=UPI0024A14E75|nr:hypothetical protein [Lentzea sp. NBRC 102530]GLY49676.1 hypothetical protein Lesp01_33320 [Lentzea sp. NBRC 102530]
MTHGISRLALAALLLLGACGSEQQFASPGDPQPSPSGNFVVHAESDSEVRVTDRDGAEVFRKTYAHDRVYEGDGVGAVWLSGKDQLWVIVPRGGAERVEAGPDGRWTAVPDELPGEITRMG